MKHHVWSQDPEGRYRNWLAEQARYHLHIVEVGCFTGKTTRRMAEETRGTIWAVDHWKGVPADPIQSKIYRDIQRSRAAFFENLRPHIQSKKVRVLEMGSAMAAKWMAKKIGPVLDMVFIDADHRYHAVKRDIQAWKPLLIPGGLLCGHDIGWPGVRKAVDEVIGEWQGGEGSIWFTHIRGA